MLAACAGGSAELAIKGPPEEGGTCRRAGAWKRGRHQMGAGSQGPGGNLSPFTNRGRSPGCSRRLCKVIIPRGHWPQSSVWELCGVRVIWSGHKRGSNAVCTGAPGPDRPYMLSSAPRPAIESLPLMLDLGPCWDLALRTGHPPSVGWSECFLPWPPTQRKLQ